MVAATTILDILDIGVISWWLYVLALFPLIAGIPALVNELERLSKQDNQAVPDPGEKRSLEKEVMVAFLVGRDCSATFRGQFPPRLN